MIAANILVAVPVMAFLTIIQTSVLPRFDYFAVMPSLPFLFALSWALLSSLEEGAVWAFIAGLFMDIFTIAPVGGLSLTYMAAVLAAGFLTDWLPANRLVIPVLTAGVATAVQQIFYFLYLRLFGLSGTLTLTSFLQIVLFQALLILPIYGAMYLVKRSIHPKPVEI